MPRTKAEQQTYDRLYKQRGYVKARQQEYFKEYRQRPGFKEKQRAAVQRYYLAAKFGMTEADYQGLLAAQEGVCAICLQAETVMEQDRVIRLSVDHDHETGRVRGLLCGRCNRALGAFGDNVALLRSATAYLDRKEEP